MQRWTSIGSLIGSLVIAVACSGDSGPSEKAKKKPESEYRDYAIHVFAQVDKGHVQLDFPPVAALNATGNSGPKPGPASSTSSLNPGSKPLVTADIDGGGPVSVEWPDLEPGWVLLMRAAAQCSKGTRLTGISAPWKPDNAWFVFSSSLNPTTGHTTKDNCEDLQQQQQVLLCTADLLKEVADTVVPITWPGGDVQYVTFDPPHTVIPFIKNTWVIPPQNSKDKFIVRDLAFTVLAHLARLDMEQPTASGPSPHLPLDVSETCADAYVESVTDPNYFVGHYETLYSQSAYFDTGIAITSNNKAALS